MKKIKVMKKTILLIAVIVGGILPVFSQEAKQIAKAQPKEEFVEAKEAGVFEFILPSVVTEEQVQKSAKFYVKYFTVAFDSSSDKAVIKMVKNDEGSRNVLTRFFVSLGVSHIEMDGKMIVLDDFRADYLK